jgi:hypothetical protein
MFVYSSILATMSDSFHAERVYTGEYYVRRHTRAETKVRELATVCLPWQHWTEISVWFDAIGMSAFHSCVVVGL